MLGDRIGFAGQQATIAQASRITGTAATISFAGQPATVKLWQNIAGTAPTISFAGQQATVVHEQRVTGTASVIAFVGQQATINHGAPIVITATAAQITFTGLQATLAQAETITASPATWTFAGQTATVTQTSGIGGSLIRRRRTKTPWWDEDVALAQLLWALGKAPPERTRRNLRDAARKGLTELIQNEPVAARYADDGALLLDTIGQTLRLQGALKAHAEMVLDDEDVSDLIHLIL